MIQRFRSRPSKAAIWARRSLVAGLVALGLVASPVLSQEEDGDVGILAGMLQDVLSDAGRDVRIRGFQGALSSRATVQEISIADDQGIWLTLTDVVIDWDRSALFNRRIEINELSAARIDLARMPVAVPSDTAMPSPTARADFSLPELPVSVNIGEVRAGLVHLEAPVIGQEAEFTLVGSAQLAGGQGETRFEARRTDGQEGAFIVAGQFDNTTRVLTLDLSLSEGDNGIVAAMLGIPGRPPLGLTVQGTGPISTFSADIALATDGQERVSGNVTIVDETPETGLLEGGGFELDIAGDLRPLLAEDLHPFFGDHAALRARGQRSDEGEITLPELAIVTGAMDVTGSAAISPAGVPRAVSLNARIAQSDGSPVLLPGTSGAGEIESAALTIAYDESVSRDWTVRAELQTLQVPSLMVETAVLDGRGRLNATGSEPLDSGDSTIPVFEGVFEFQAQGVGADDPALQQAIGENFFGLASLTWMGQGVPVELSGLTFEGDTVSLSAYGQLDGLTFDGFTELEAPDLSAFSAIAGRPLGGHALASVQGQMNPLTGALDVAAELTTRGLEVDIPEADTLLAGESRISLSLRRDTEGTTLRSFQLTAGTMAMTASGSLEPGAADVQAQLGVPDLGALGPGYGGSVALEAQVNTTESTTRLRLDGEVVDIALAELPAAGILGGIFIGTNRLQADVVLEDGVTRIAQADLTGPRVALRAEGSYSAAAPDVTVTLDRLDMAALTPGGRGSLTGRAEMVGEAGTTRYALLVDGQGQLATGIEMVDALLGPDTRLEARATSTPDGAFRIDTAHLDANGARLQVTGQQAANGTARFAIQTVVDNIGRLVPGFAGQVSLEGGVTRPAGGGGYDVNLRLAGPSQLNATATGRVNDDFTVALNFNGQLQSQLLNARLEPASVSGLVRFNGTMNGQPGIDALRMDASLSQGRYTLPGAGISFGDIEAQARLTGLNAQISLTGRSLTGGTGAIQGRIALDQGADADLSVTVRELIVQQPQLFEASVSGTVRLLGQLGAGALVSGEVNVDTAEIRIPNSPLGRNGFNLAGLRHVAEEAASRQTRVNAGIASGTRVGAAPVALRLDLQLNAPGRVFVRGRGLDAELGGTLRLGGTTRAVIPAGEFTLVRGRLDILGNRFSLTDGSASMVGSFMPFIRLTATTESDGVLTSITLSGEANEPEITFSSSPELPEDEVLARLIFRRSLSSLTPFQAAQLALSVATLTGRADNSIISRTREAMGLDDLDFTVNEDGETQLRAGRHIGERLYTDVSVDSGGGSEVTINLDLTPTITLRGAADSAGGSSVGIFYERDY